MAITLWFSIGSSSFRSPMIGGTLVLWPIGQAQNNGYGGDAAETFVQGVAV